MSTNCQVIFHFDENFRFWLEGKAPQDPSYERRFFFQFCWHPRHPRPPPWTNLAWGQLPPRLPAKYGRLAARPFGRDWSILSAYFRRLVLTQPRAKLTWVSYNQSIFKIQKQSKTWVFQVNKKKSENTGEPHIFDCVFDFLVYLGLLNRNISWTVLNFLVIQIMLLSAQWVCGDVWGSLWG